MCRTHTELIVFQSVLKACYTLRGLLTVFGFVCVAGNISSHDETFSLENPTVRQHLHVHVHEASVDSERQLHVHVCVV